MSQLIFLRVALATLVSVAFFNSTSAHAELTESELFLSELKSADTPAELPSTLILPAVWIDGMRKLAAITNSTNKEAGACLNMVAESRSEGRNELMARYATLASRKSQMPPQEYAEQERALRELIEKGGSSIVNGVKWSFGAIQRGNDTSVAIHDDITKCDGNNIGIVHTHPSSSLDVPSDSDLAALIASKRRISAVIYGDRTCVTLKAIRSINRSNYMLDYGTFHYAYAYYAAAQHASFFEFTRENSLEKFNSSGVLHSTIAGVTEKFGAALYCGEIGGALKRMPAHRHANINEEIFILLAKSLIIAWGIENPKLKIPAFSFTPTFDEEFKRALSVFGVEDKFLGEISPFDLYLQILRSRKANFGTIQNGFIYPDIRGKNLPALTTSASCSFKSNYPGEYTCFLSQAKFESLASVIAERYYAKYFSNGKVWESVMPMPFSAKGFLAKRYDSGDTYHGDCIYIKDTCTPDGVGVFHSTKGNMIVHATFVKGQPLGEATQERKDTGERWKVFYEEKGFREIERLK